MSNLIYNTPVVPFAKPGDALYEAREEWWTYDLLNNNDEVMGPLEGVVSGSGKLTFNVHNEIKTGGQLIYKGEEIDWDIRRIKVNYHFRTRFGEDGWPLGVYLVTTPEDQYSPDGVSRQLDLMDKLKILIDDKVEWTYTVPAGTVVTDRVKFLLGSTNETQVTVEDSDEVTQATLTWPVGTSKLRIINDLLESINYFSVWVDLEGYFRVHPYVKPRSRPIAFTFKSGEKSIFSGSYTRVKDRYNLPNKYIVKGQSDGDSAYVPRGTAIDEVRYKKLGRWVAITEDGVEATSQEKYNELAERRLFNAQTTNAKIKIQHAAIPPEMNGRIKFDSKWVDVESVMQEMEVPLKAGALSSTQLLEIV